MKTTDDHEEVLFREAVKRPQGAARKAFLDGACMGDQALYARLEALLEAHEQPDSFFEPLAAGLVGAAIVLPPEEGPGTVIGRYTLREKIGEGGCGSVYVAEQDQPVRRRVALKIIKLGMDTKQVVGRFEAERQALALMDHPNIAKVFDAGATDTGRPFFVMELVRGVLITDYCDQHHLPTEDRLKLFVEVCHAVQHAHQKGVIHRDIKPSNILVMLADDVPVPKMIDFGIAKAIGEKLTDKTVYTRFERFIGTPSYMSPEQAGTSGLDVDTRSDIYALGVLLYELLTDRTPFEPKQLAKAGLEEILRSIREVEPPKPSTRLIRLEPKERTTTAQRRATEAPKLIRSLRGDLDWIVMKCLEKNRTRRYETANELAKDIECHLRHQPVSAAAPTLVYRGAKYVRRHRRVLLTAGALVLMGTLGTALSVWEARRAALAEAAQARLRKVEWALGTALPKIERFLEKDDYADAFDLFEQAQPFVGKDGRFQALAAQLVRVISVETEPPGAQVFIRDYMDLNPKWEPVGRSPLKDLKLPRGFKRWRITMPGYESAEGALDTTRGPAELKVTLDRTRTIPPEMVRVHGQKFRASLGHLDPEELPELNLSDFLLDRYEVTNRRYQEFVEAGGYRKPQYWKQKFVKDGIELSWEAAMKLLVDQTGQPSPATWRNGQFPASQGDYPVAGVSWYEAAAYAEFTGKRLPTVYHWSLAAGDLAHRDVGFVIPLSNFAGTGLAPVGTYQGMTSHGIYDMAGNVKEWCFNEFPEGYRVSAGGGWKEPQYLFSEAEKLPPFLRQATFGFRCMKPLARDGVWEQAARPVAYRPPVVGNQLPCPEPIFRAYLKLYDYPKSELQPSIDARTNVSIYTRREKVSFNAAYGEERMIAYLYLPRLGKIPFQTVIFWPGAAALQLHSIQEYTSPDTFEPHTSTGRAFVFPVLYGTLERRGTSDNQPRATPLEVAIMRVKDFKRTIDYLETRAEEFDMKKSAYEGVSWGAKWGGVLPAVEPRVKVVVMFGGGLSEYPEECSQVNEEWSQVNFAPRISVPILLQNGRYDSAYPVESSQKPFLKLFGTAEQDKHHKIYETGHAAWWKNEVRKDELDFLDKYFGPAK